MLSQEMMSQCPAGYHSTGVERVTNGEFDSGNSGFSSDYTNVNDNPAVQNELNPEGYYSIWDNPNDLHSNFSACSGVGGSGNFMIINGATVEDEEVWNQTISVSTNTVYYFTVWISSVHASNPAELQFSVNGVNLDVPFNASTRTCDWEQFYATWNSGANTNADISVVNKNTVPSGNDFALDYVSFMPCELDVLPVEISIFEISKVKREESVKIEWTTVTEINNDYFSIERSEDGVNFEAIHLVGGAGSSNHEIMYSVVDEDPFYGTSYYRIKQTDYDGNYKYSELRMYKNSSLKFTLAPNPIYNSGELSIWFRGYVPDEFFVTIVATNGEVVYRSKEISEDSMIKIQKEFEPGVYYINVSSKNQTESKKIVIL